MADRALVTSGTRELRKHLKDVTKADDYPTAIMRWLELIDYLHSTKSQAILEAWKTKAWSPNLKKAWSALLRNEVASLTYIIGDFLAGEPGTDYMELKTMELLTKIAKEITGFEVHHDDMYNEFMLPNIGHYLMRAGQNGTFSTEYTPTDALDHLWMGDKIKENVAHENVHNELWSKQTSTRKTAVPETSRPANDVRKRKQRGMLRNRPVVCKKRRSDERTKAHGNQLPTEHRTPTNPKIRPGSNIKSILKRHNIHPDRIERIRPSPPLSTGCWIPRAKENDFGKSTSGGLTYATRAQLRKRKPMRRDEGYTKLASVKHATIIEEDEQEENTPEDSVDNNNNLHQEFKDNSDQENEDATYDMEDLEPELDYNLEEELKNETLEEYEEEETVEYEDSNFEDMTGALTITLNNSQNAERPVKPPMVNVREKPINSTKYQSYVIPLPEQRDRNLPHEHWPAPSNNNTEKPASSKLRGPAPRTKKVTCIKAKNLVCSYHQQGSCKFGDLCKFNHQVPSSSKMAKNCQYWAGGYCENGESCNFRHGLGTAPSPKFPMDSRH